MLKVLRIWARKQQIDVAKSIKADQSTVSRIENGDVFVTAEMEWGYVDACGGETMLKTLIDHLQSLLDRLNTNRLITA